MLDEGYDLADPLKGGYVNFESARKATWERSSSPFGWTRLLTRMDMSAADARVD